MAVAPIAAQTVVTIPPAFETLPGNAAVSMPARWSWGRMQTIIDRGLVPDSLPGQTVTAIRLRKPAFLGEPAYPARTLTFEVRLSAASRWSRSMSGDMTVNAKGTPTVVFGAGGGRAYSMPATPAPGLGDTVGARLIDLPLAQPFVVPDDHLLVDWTNHDTALTVSADHWIDAVTTQGSDIGAWVTVGQSGCSGRPLELGVVSAAPPAFDRRVKVGLLGAEANRPGIVMLGVNPQAGNGPGNPGFGQLFAPYIPGCHLWTYPEVTFSATADVGGAFEVDLDFPPAPSPAARGLEIGLQALVFGGPQTAPTLGLSNGVVLLMDTIGVGNQAATGFAPRDATFAPWPVQFGTTPVYQFVH